MDPRTPDVFDASYRYFSQLLANRGRTLPRKVVGKRVEQVFHRLCADLEPTLSVEIGAHEAGFSRWLKGQVPRARCLAFEANPYVHEKYAGALAGSGVEYHHLAVSEVDGTVELGIPRQLRNREHGRRFGKDRDSRMASLAPNLQAEETETVTVPSVVLDDFVTATDDDVVVAWIDVEGASGPVLRSGKALLSRASLVFIEVETEPVWEGQWLDLDVARFLAGCGLVPVLRDVQRKHQHNVVFASTAIATDRRTARMVNRVFRHKGA